MWRERVERNGAWEVEGYSLPRVMSDEVEAVVRERGLAPDLLVVALLSRTRGWFPDFEGFQWLIKAIEEGTLEEFVGSLYVALHRDLGRVDTQSDSDGVETPWGYNWRYLLAVQGQVPVFILWTMYLGDCPDAQSVSDGLRPLESRSRLVQWWMGVRALARVESHNLPEAVRTLLEEAYPGLDIDEASQNLQNGSPEEVEAVLDALCEQEEAWEVTLVPRWEREWVEEGETHPLSWEELEGQDPESDPVLRFLLWQFRSRQTCHLPAWEERGHNVEAMYPMTRYSWARLHMLWLQLVGADYLDVLAWEKGDLAAWAGNLKKALLRRLEKGEDQWRVVLHPKKGHGLSDGGVEIVQAERPAWWGPLVKVAMVEGMCSEFLLLLRDTPELWPRFGLVEIRDEAGGRRYFPGPTRIGGAFPPALQGYLVDHMGEILMRVARGEIGPRYWLHLPRIPRIDWRGSRTGTFRSVVEHSVRLSRLRGEGPMVYQCGAALLLSGGKALRRAGYRGILMTSYRPSLDGARCSLVGGGWPQSVVTVNLTEIGEEINRELQSGGRYMKAVERTYMDHCFVMRPAWGWPIHINWERGSIQLTGVPVGSQWSTSRKAGREIVTLIKGSALGVPELRHWYPTYQRGKTWVWVLPDADWEHLAWSHMCGIFWVPQAATVMQSWMPSEADYPGVNGTMGQPCWGNAGEIMSPEERRCWMGPGDVQQVADAYDKPQPLWCLWRSRGRLRHDTNSPWGDQYAVYVSPQWVREIGWWTRQKLSLQMRPGVRVDMAHRLVEEVGIAVGYREQEGAVVYGNPTEMGVGQWVWDLEVDEEGSQALWEYRRDGQREDLDRMREGIRVLGIAKEGVMAWLDGTEDQLDRRQVQLWWMRLREGGWGLARSSDWQWLVVPSGDGAHPDPARGIHTMGPPMEWDLGRVPYIEEVPERFKSPRWPLDGPQDTIL